MSTWSLTTAIWGTESAIGLYDYSFWFRELNLVGEARCTFVSRFCKTRENFTPQADSFQSLQNNRNIELQRDLSPYLRVSDSTFLQVDNSTFPLFYYSKSRKSHLQNSPLFHRNTIMYFYSSTVLQFCTFVFLYKYNNTFLYCCIFVFLYFCISTAIHPFVDEILVIKYPISINFSRNFHGRNCTAVFRPQENTQDGCMSDNGRNKQPQKRLYCDLRRAAARSGVALQ